MKDERKNKVNNFGNKKRTLILPSLILLLLFISLGSYVNSYEPVRVPLKKEFYFFPRNISEWQGSKAPPLFDKFLNLGVDNDLSRMYVTDKGDAVHLYIGYFEYQRQGKEMIHYSTKNIHRFSSEIEVELGNENDIKVNKVISENKEGRKVMLFWYDINGRIVTDRYMAKAYMIWDSLLHGKSNGAIIMLTSEFGSKDDDSVILSENKQFLQEIYPYFQDYLPHM